jgi:hypothetical protein
MTFFAELFIFGNIGDLDDEIRREINKGSIGSDNG